jgi:S-methylmethionine-dependent homocysteine/selenocysteine methylase
VRLPRAAPGPNAAIEAKRAGASRQLPVYISWTLDEEPGKGLRSGESVAAAFQAVADLDLDGFLFNCTTPEAIATGLETLLTLTDRPIGGYPNRYHVPEGWTLGEAALPHDESFTTQLFVAGALKAFAGGATIYGGCCTVGPDDIAALARAVTEGS